MHRPKTITVALVERDGGINSKISQLLEGGEFHLGCTLNSAGDALRNVDWNLVDILLCGSLPPPTSGFELIRRARVSNPSILPVILAEDLTWEVLKESLHAGVTGFLLKRDLDEIMVTSLRYLMKGGAPVHPFLASRILKEFVELTRPRSEPVLSHRELQILSYLTEGELYKQIAESLGISVHTVHNHAKRIYAKLGVGGRSQALQFAQESGLGRRLAKVRGERRAA
jgi:DNA-binding NarL/FixJ family response regulator